MAETCEPGHWPADEHGRCPQCFERIAVPLSTNERDVLAGLIRDNVKKIDRGILNGREKWSDYDDQPARSRIAVLLSAYRKLGFDPVDFERPHQSEPFARPAGQITDPMLRS